MSSNIYINYTNPNVIKNPTSQCARCAHRAHWLVGFFFKTFPTLWMELSTEYITEYNGVNTELNGAHNGAKSLNIQYPLHGLQWRLTELYTESLTDPNRDKRSQMELISIYDCLFCALGAYSGSRSLLFHTLDTSTLFCLGSLDSIFYVDLSLSC